MSGVRALMLAALCFIWGSTWVVIKIGLDVTPPFLGAACRFGLSALILLALARARGVPWPRSARTHGGLLLVGVFGFGISYGSVYWGEQYIASGLSAVLFAMHPFFVMAIAHVMLPAEPVTGRKAVGAALGFAGVVLIFMTDLQFTHPLGLTAAAVTLLSPLLAAASNVGIKRWGHRLHPYTLTALPMAYASLLLGVMSLLTEPVAEARWTPAAVAAIVYLAVFGSVVAFVILYTLLKQVPVSLLSLVSYAFPVVAIALGFVVLGETLEPQAIAGTAAIIAGIAVATSGQRAGTRTATT